MCTMSVSWQNRMGRQSLLAHGRVKQQQRNNVFKLEFGVRFIVFTSLTLIVLFVFIYCISFNLPTHISLILYRVFLIAHFCSLCIVSVNLFISTVYLGLVVFTAYIVIISFTNCYIHIFSSSAAGVFNKFSSAIRLPCFNKLELSWVSLSVLAHLSKTNSRTFQGLSRTIQTIYKEN